MKTLTIFTPSYNRAHLLPRLYESLCRQTCNDFRWLIVDDGSVDGTREIVKHWVDEKLVEIEYVYKPNGGMHTAHNLAYSLIHTEINTCIDSDDKMPPGAVESIISNWLAVANDPTVGGLVGLDQSVTGELIGSELPPNGTRTTLGRLYSEQGVSGDKKLVYRSSVTRDAPRYPEYAGERLVPLSWLYTQIDREYKLVCVNDAFVIVDYQSDGSSATIIRQYFQSPRGFRDARVVNMQYGIGWSFIIRNVVHYGISSLILRDYGYFKKSPKPILSLLTAPVSAIALFWLLAKEKKWRIFSSR